MPETESQAVLCVDLDGTLISTDLLWEGVVEFVRGNPLEAWKLAVWLLRGRAYFKEQLARRVGVEAALLPYRAEVMGHLRQQAAAGQKLVLASGSPRAWAEAVAAHVGLFDAVIASDGTSNCTGRRKVERVQEQMKQWGAQTFDYIGNCHADMPVWRAARQRLVAGGSASVLRKAQGMGAGACLELKAVEAGNALWQLARAARPYQWSKNLLLIVPLILSHQVLVRAKLEAVVLGFLAFCACASAVYLVNDVMDLRADRHHPRKKRRPLASGKLQIKWALATAVVLGVAGVAMAGVWLPREFLAWLLAYAALTTLYSLVLKRLFVADVLALAALYTLRLLAGGAAAEVWVSPWLIAFSLCIFMSLALAKRYAELLVVLDNQGHEAKGRGYRVRDIRRVRTIGPIVGFAAAVVMALYMNSQMVREMYVSPAWLWPVGPLVLIWIARVWWMARHRALEEDPVLFALRDPWSHALGIGVLICGVLAATSR